MKVDLKRLTNEETFDLVDEAMTYLIDEQVVDIIKNWVRNQTNQAAWRDELIAQLEAMGKEPNDG